MTEVRNADNIVGPATTPLHRTNADDPQVRSWERGMHVVSRETLLESARRAISQMTLLPHGWDGHRGCGTVPLAALTMNGVLDRLVADDGPTPQITPRADGGIGAEWLVGGNCLDIEVGPGGHVSLVIENSAGEELHNGSFSYHAPDTVSLDQAKAFLEKVAESIQHRVISV